MSQKAFWPLVRFLLTFKILWSWAEFAALCCTSWYGPFKTLQLQHKTVSHVLRNRLDAFQILLKNILERKWALCLEFSCSRWSSAVSHWNGAWTWLQAAGPTCACAVGRVCVSGECSTAHPRALLLPAHPEAWNHGRICLAWQYSLNSLENSFQGCITVRREHLLRALWLRYEVTLGQCTGFSG